MAIYSLADLRNSAPQELRDLPDDELVREYSRRKKVPFNDVADYLNLKPKGFLPEMSRQLVGGLAVDVPKMVGQSQQFLARELPRLTEAFEIGAQAQAMAAPGSYDPRGELSLKPSGAVAETGRRLVEESTALAPKFEPDMRGRGLTQQTFLSGARAVAPVAATIPAAVVPGGVPFAVAGLFGTSQAQDTYEKLIAQGVPEDEARQASYRTGAIQGIGEGLATYVGGKLFKPLLGRAGGGTTAGVVAEMTDTGIIKPFAKGLGINLLVQPTTEIAQDVGTSMVEQSYGSKPEDLMEIAKQSAMGATGLTLLLGPLAFGSHVSRSNNAATLKAALSDDPRVPQDIRAQAIAAVNVEAQRQGVDPKDIGRWTQEQIELEDRRTDALRRMEEAAQNLEVGAGINQRVGISGQRVNEADYIAQFEEAFNEPSGQFTYERLPDGSDAPRELSMGEVMERQANTDPSAPKDLLRSSTPKTAKEILAEIRQTANDPMSPSVWRFPVSTGLQGDQRGQFAAGPEAFQQTPGQTWRSSLRGGPQVWRYPVSTGLEDQRRAQFAAGPESITAPTTTTPSLSPAQQLAAGGPAALTSAGLPVRKTVPPGGVSTTLPSAAPVAPGAFSTAPAAPIQAAVKPVKAVKAVKPVVAKVAKAPKAPVLKKTVIARSIEQALDEEMEVADKTLDDARAKKIMADVNKEDLGAEVQGAKQIKAPGRVSLSQRSLLGIRDAIFRKSGKVAKAFGRKEQKVVDAVSTFTNAYDAYLDYSTNMFREIEAKRTTADESTAGLEDLAKDVQNSLYNLGQSLDNNAKNVEAVVRVVKDTVQQKLAKPGKTKKETLKALKTLDTALSSGWAAAKRESFMKELPDLAEVSGQVVRPSTEMQEKAGGKLISNLEDAAKNGYGNPQKTAAKVDGLKGVLQYLRFNTTPMGKVIARALRDALDQSENPAKISFVDKSGSRYDPKTNTVYINKSEQSAEVVLHEAFHAALQWYVYQNPNAPAVKQLQLSLKRALDAKGLEGKALEVQNILQKLVNKERGLDAVLELISYNATLNEFRRAMQEIKTGDAPKSFLDSIKSVWAMYKALVRRMLGVGDNVASDVLSASMELLEQSTKATMPKSLTGKALDIATTAFKRWFGDSKVVDSDGQPLVVYHGTANSFAEFSSKLLGGATGAPSAKLGFFFAGSPVTAAKYARNAEKSNRRNKTETEVRLDIEKESIEHHVNRIAEEKARQTDEAYRNFSDSMKEKYGVDNRDSKTARQSYDEMIQRNIDYHEESISKIQSKVKKLENLVAEEKGIAAKGEKTGANIIPVFLSIKNPMVIDQKKSPYRIMSYYETLKKAKAAGYDGVVIKNTYDGMPQPGWITSLIAKVRKLETPSDTIYIAFDSNQIKSIFNQEPTEAPGILEAKVQSGTALPESLQDAASGMSNLQMSNSQLAKYSKTILPRLNVGEMMFNKLGWSDWMQQLDSKVVSKISNYINDKTPQLAKAVAWMNSTAFQPVDVNDLIKHMKDVKLGHTALTQAVASHISRLPVSVFKENLNYINERLDFHRGLVKEPNYTGKDTYLKTLIDHAIDNYWTHITEGGMTGKDRVTFAGKKVGNRWVGGLRFTQSMVFPTSVKKISSQSFGSRNMNALKADRTKTEVTDDSIRFRVDAEGSPILGDKFIGLYTNDAALQRKLISGKTLADIQPDEFISIELAKKGIPRDSRGIQFIHDPAFEWNLDRKGKGGFKLTARYDAAQAKEISNLMLIADALQNTLTLAADSYASNQFGNSLNQLGAVDTDENGNVTVRDGSSMVFDNVDQLNEAMNGEGVGENFKPNKDQDTWTRTVDESKLISISDPESTSEDIKNLFRNRNQWVKIPNSEQTYGVLAGKIVNGSLWAAIQDASDRRPIVRIPGWQPMMRFYKSVKTKWLPVTWSANILGNVGFALIDDIPMRTIPHAARLYLAAQLSVDQREKYGLTLSKEEEDLMAKILNSNALVGTFASSELKIKIYESMKKHLVGPEQSIPERMMQMMGMGKDTIQYINEKAGVGKDAAIKVNEFTNEWYAMQDNVFRVASVLNQLGMMADSGINITQKEVEIAGKHARRSFLDYDIDAKGVRVLAETELPFFRFAYAATKYLGYLSVHKPWKIPSLLILAGVIDAALSSMSGDDEEDEKMRPVYMREKIFSMFGYGVNSYIRLPGLGDDENPVMFHLGKIIYPMSLTDTRPNGFMGLDWWPSSLTPSGPASSIIQASVSGVDPFTGNKLSSPIATSAEKFLDRAIEIQSMFAPNLPLVSIKETKKLFKTLQDNPEQSESATAMKMAKYLGLMVYSYNTYGELARQDRAVRKIKSDYSAEISKIRREIESHNEPDWDAFEEKQTELLDRMEKAIAKRRGEKEE